MNQSVDRLKETRSDMCMSQGGMPWPSHRESLSARSLLWPAMCDASTSMPVEEIRMLSFSVNRANGMVVVKSVLETLSAAELSDKVGSLIGMRNPGWNLVATKISAICAKVSRLEMSF